jgi:hypothetical protein
VAVAVAVAVAVLPAASDLGGSAGPPAVGPPPLPHAAAMIAMTGHAKRLTSAL